MMATIRTGTYKYKLLKWLEEQHQAEVPLSSAKMNEMGYGSTTTESATILAGLERDGFIKRIKGNTNGHARGTVAVRIIKTLSKDFVPEPAVPKVYQAGSPHRAPNTPILDSVDADVEAAKELAAGLKEKGIDMKVEAQFSPMLLEAISVLKWARTLLPRIEQLNSEVNELKRNNDQLSKTNIELRADIIRRQNDGKEE